MMIKVWLVIIFAIAVGLYIQNDKSHKPTSNPVEIKTNTKIKTEIKKTVPLPRLITKPVQSPKLVQSKTAELKKQKSSLGDDFIPFDEHGNRYITQINVVGKHLVYHGDLLIGNSEDLEKLQTQQVITQPKPQKWPRGEVPFTVDESLPNDSSIAEAIEYIHKNSKIKFIPREKQKNFVRFTKGESDCYSYAGMKGGEQEIFLTPRCHTKEILHEVMHTLGFLHEQNREDRDQFIKIFWDNIEPINHVQFKKIPNDFLGVKNRPFDFDSIMMYTSYTFSIIEDEPALLTLDGSLIVNKNIFLSPEDLLRLNLAYP